MSRFTPNLSNSVVEGLVGDSGIENRSRLLKIHSSGKITSNLWGFAKKINVTTEEEEEAIKILEGMEMRDKVAKEAESLKIARKDQKVSVDLL